MSDALAHYRAAWERFAAGRNDAGSGLRRAAIDHFCSEGFPTTRLEDWRYTNVSALAKQRLELPQASASISREQLEAVAFPLFACSLVVFVDGRFSPELSTPPALSGGISATSLASALRETPDPVTTLLGSLADSKGHPFVALNSAFLGDGALVRIAKGTQKGTQTGTQENPPLHLVFLSTGSEPARAIHPRVLIECEAGSQALLIEDHVSLGNGATLTNSVAEVWVGENASLEYVSLQRASDTGFQFSTTRARIERNGRLASHFISLSGRLVRNDLRVGLYGEGAECDLRGLFLGSGERIVDNHTWIDHEVPHCTSRELYKGILGGHSRGVFRGRVVVRPDAQKSDAQQSNPNLLLGAGAQINTKPQLEIYADDVKCSHGSTVGQLDPDALFYLRARGIGESQALELLTQGFAAEITAALPSEALAQRMAELVVESLASTRGESG